MTGTHASTRFASRPNGSRSRKKAASARRTMFAYEKGLIWGNDNYRTNGALVNIALATGNIGRPGGGCVRMGGHQEGYVRPPTTRSAGPAPYVDQLLIDGKGGVHHIWACDHYKTTLERRQIQAELQEADRPREGRDVLRPLRRPKAMVDAILGAIRRAACSRSTSTSCRPRSAKPATSGSRARRRAR